MLTGCKTKWYYRTTELASSLQPQEIPELDGQKIPIAVYDFLDKTGQRKPNERSFQT